MAEGLASLPLFRSRPPGVAVEAPAGVPPDGQHEGGPAVGISGTSSVPKAQVGVPARVTVVDTGPAGHRPATLAWPAGGAGAAAAGTAAVSTTGADRPTGVGSNASGRVRQEVDWPLVRALRQQAAERLTVQLASRPGLDEAGRRELGRALVVELLREHTAELVSTGGVVFDPAAEQRLAQAVLDALFGLGRLQPLVDDEGVENVEIDGCDTVHMVYADGRVERGPAVADSDEELLEQLQFLAARAPGGAERSFSPSRPFLDLTLPGGARLAARAWVTPRPSVVVRRHRLREVTLPGLVQRRMLDPGLATFLAAAVRARRSIVVAGPQGAGKTTLVRALCAEIDPLERLGTVETEYELFLHEMPHRHPRVVAHEARPGSGERGADGRPAGEVTLDDLLYASLRMNLSRVIVGEVRGREVIPMFKAMQAGAGSLSTVHAHSARAAVERLVTCALESGPHVTVEFAHRQIAEHVDLVVQLAQDEPVPGGPRARYAREVIEVGRGEAGLPAVTDVYVPGPDGRAVPHSRPSFLPVLLAAGFDGALLNPGTDALTRGDDLAAGGWGAAAARPGGLR